MPSHPPAGAYSATVPAVTAWSRFSCVGDLDLAGLGLLGDGDGQGEHAIFVGGAQVVSVEALSEEQLAAEFTLGPFGDLDLIALSRRTRPRVARTVSRSFSTVQLDEAGIHAG